MLSIHFYKYQGAGNDFILVDNRQGEFSRLDYRQIASLCDRRFGIGADGFMMLERHARYPFCMSFFNSDGMPGSMCGNGGRCIAAFARDLEVVETGKKFVFWSSDGEHEATVLSKMKNQQIVRLKMKDVAEYAYSPEKHIYLIDTGSPHYIRFVEDCEGIPVEQEGKKIRFSKDFPQGINVDFVEVQPQALQVRTYERGVEAETYSCGTGATASSMAYALEAGFPDGHHVVRNLAKGGTLQVDFLLEAGKAVENQPDMLPSGFHWTGNRKFSQVFLEGLATFVFDGWIDMEEQGS